MEDFPEPDSDRAEDWREPDSDEAAAGFPNLF